MAAPKIRYIDFSPSDWLAGTIGLSYELKGVYWDVCALIYDAGEPIRNDARLISRRDRSCRANRIRRLLDELVALGKLALTDDGRLTNRRCDKELDKTERRISGARNGGLMAHKVRITKKQAVENRKEINGRRPSRGATHHSSYESSSYKNSTVAAREPSPAHEAPARAQAGPDPVTQVATALRSAPPTGGAGDGRPPTPDEIARLVAELGVDPDTVETPPAPGPRQDVIVEGVQVEEPPSLAELAAAARAKFLNGGGS